MMSPSESAADAVIFEPLTFVPFPLPISAITKRSPSFVILKCFLETELSLMTKSLSRLLPAMISSFVISMFLPVSFPSTIVSLASAGWPERAERSMMAVFSEAISSSSSSERYFDEIEEIGGGVGMESDFFPRASFLAFSALIFSASFFRYSLSIVGFALF